MSNVDERVVRMQFDGKGFEAGATHAIGILDKLSESLKFKNGTKGLENIQASSNKFNMNGISDGIAIVSERFSLFQEFVTGVFRRLGERAADFGTNLIRNVTLKPMTDGFSEYELQMRSIQTISANTGLAGDEGIGKINDALDELNVYADKTIYNFSEMTRNIGTFTAAGIDLKTSTKAIQGIANLAAVSGSTSQQASTAMYQLSQALASGTVKLQDWNSVVNAGMGGKVFQEALKRTARAHGIAVDEIIEKQGSFRESLQEGWITSEVLTDTLNQLAISYKEVGDETYNAAYAKLLDEGYSKDDAEEILRLAKTAEDAATMVRTWSQLWETVGEALGSGWSTSFRIIIGDFQKATELFTWLSKKISGIVDESSDARNKVLEEWAEAGGRDALVGAIANMFTAVERPLKAMADSFSAVFGISGEELAVLTEDFAKFTEKLVISEQDADYLAGTFDILFGILSGAISVVSDLASYFGDFAGSILDALHHANAFRRVAKIIKNISKAIYKPLRVIGKAFGEVFNFDDKFSGKAAGVIGRFLRFLENMSKSMIISKDSAKKLHDVFKGLFEVIANLLDPLGDVGKSFQDFFNILSKNVKDSNFLDGFITTISDAFSKLNFSDIFGKLSLGAGIGIFGFIGKFIKDILDKVSELKEGINPLSGFNGLLDKVGESLQAWQKNLKTSTLLKLAAAIGIIALSLFALSRIPQDKVVSTLELFTGAIVGLLGAFAGFNKLGSKSKTGPAVSLLLVAGALLILSFALNRLKDLNMEQLGTGLAAIGGMLLELMVALNKMPDSGKILSSAVAMLIMSVAIGALALSMKLIATMSWEDIVKGLATIAGILIEFTVALNKMPDSGRILSSAVAMLIMSVAIGALSLSMKLLSTISWEDIVKGLGTIAILLVEFTVALNSMPDSGRILSSAAAMLIMSIAIGGLALSMKLLSTISWEGIVKGVGTIAVLLVELGVALKLFQANIGGAAAMLIAAVAIGALALSMKLLSTINLEGVVNALLSMAGMLVILGVALAVFQANIGGAVAMLIASVAMIALAGAVNLLVPALMTLSTLSLDQLGIALLALGGAFLIVGGAAMILSAAAAPTFVFSISMLALAAAAYLVAKAIETLITALTPILPAMIQAGSDLVNGFVKAVTDLRTAIVNKAIEIGTAFLDSIKSFFGINSPSTVMADVGGNVVQGLINGIGDLLGSLVSKAGEIGTSILNGVGDIASWLGDKAHTGMDAFTNTVGSFVGTVTEKGTEVGTSVINGVGDLASSLKTKAVDSCKNFIDGFNSKLGSVKTASKSIKNGVVNQLKDLKTKMKSEASNGVNALTKAISSGAGSARSAARNLVNAAKNGLGSLHSAFYNVGSNGAMGFISGIGSKISSAAAKAAELARAAIEAAKKKLDINSPSKVFRALGLGVGEGFEQGIDRSIKPVSKASEELGETVPESFSKGLKSLSLDIDDLLDTDYNPVITPVINSAEFDSGMYRLSSAINGRFNDISIGNLNYTGELNSQLSDANDLNRKAIDVMSANTLDYNRLGVAVATALINSGLHVEMDGGQLMGYLAGEIIDARRMYGTR